MSVYVDQNTLITQVICMTESQSIVKLQSEQNWTTVSAFPTWGTEHGSIMREGQKQLETS